MPRYVILEHDWPTQHWDLLLEAGDVLRAWRLLGAPDSGVPIAAEANFDHRLIYLDYEGPLTGNRGNVKRWDQGMFEWQQETGSAQVLALTGCKLQGRARLWREGSSWRWQFVSGSH